MKEAEILFLDAAESGDIGTVRKFLKQGVSVDTPDNRYLYKNRTALMHAAEKGHADVVTELLCAGADLHSRDVGTKFDTRGGNTALLLALKKGHARIAHQLIEAGADLNARSGGATVLGQAAFLGDPDLVRRILSNGADPNLRKSKMDNIPLVHALLGKHEPIVEILLTAGADPNVVDLAEGTPLQYAASFGLENAVRLLLHSGADSNSRSAYGFTPLMFAVLEGKQNVVPLLLEAGAAVDAQNVRGETSLDLCRMNQRRETEESMRKKNESGISAESGYPSRHVDIAEMLLAAGAKEGEAFKVGLPAALITESSNSQPERNSTGMESFRSLVNDTQPEWAILAIKARIKKVVTAFLKLHPEAERHPAIKIKPAKNGDDVTQNLIPFLEIKQSDWTIVLLEVMSVSPDAIESSGADAKELSKQLNTRALSFAAESTADAISYELFDSGDLLEKAEWIDGGEFTTFKSEMRQKPELEEVTDGFMDNFLKQEGIYLPACYVATDAKEFWLAVDAASSNRIGKAAIVEIPKLRSVNH